MDNRIANDMISSGMIPSGEKKKEDLGRPQYGSAPSPNALLDAYKSMYDKKEEVINEHHKKDADGNTIPHEGEELNEGKIPAGLQAYLDKKKGKKEDKKDVKEGNQRDPESSKKDKTYSKQPDPSKDGFTGIGNMSVNDIMKMNAKMKKDKKEVKEAAGAGMIVKGLMKSVAQGAAAQLGAQATSGLMGNRGVQKTKDKVKNLSNTQQPVAASADLFDIVKGQLLDEGLTEEEIKDIMLTLTPDEILAEMNGKATPEAGTGKYYDEKNPTAKQKEIQKNLPQNRKPTPEQQAARDKYAKIRDMTNKGDHQGASKLYNS